MARQYAPSSKVAGLSGSLATFQGGELVDPGSPLDTSQTFDVQYFYTARYTDSSGVVQEFRQMIQVRDIPLSASIGKIIDNIQAERASLTAMGAGQVGQYPDVVYTP